MLAFVVKAVKKPDSVEKEDLDSLHDLGWTDSDIMDALARGTNMIGSSILMKAFKMDQACQSEVNCIHNSRSNDAYD